MIMPVLQIVDLVMAFLKCPYEEDEDSEYVPYAKMEGP